MTLSKLAILLGSAIGLLQLWPILKPVECGAALRKFHRNETWGYILMAIGTAWFLYNLNREAIAEFAAYKPHMLIGFCLVAVATCIFVTDYLAVRGLCIVMLMLASYLLSFTRASDSPWRLVLVIAAYAWIVVSMWWMVSPWRFRDLMAWATATPERLRKMSMARLAFAVFVIILGATAF